MCDKCSEPVSYLLTEILSELCWPQRSRGRGGLDRLDTPASTDMRIQTQGIDSDNLDPFSQ